MKTTCTNNLCGDTSLIIELGSNVQVTLDFADDRYLGIASVSCAGRVFLSAGRGSLPWCRTPDGITYDEFHLVEHQDNADEHRLVFAAIGRPAPVAADTDMFGFPLTTSNQYGMRVQDTLEMTLQAATEAVGGEQWHGFTVAYTWRSSKRRIHWLTESVALAPDGEILGSRLLAQNMTQHYCPLETVIEEDTAWSTQEYYDRTCIDTPCRGGGAQIFDLVQGETQAVVSFFRDAPLRANSIRGKLDRLPGEGFATSTDLHYAALTHEFRTSPRTVLACPRRNSSREEAIDRWSAWHEFTAELWCRQIGITRSRSKPMLTFEGTGVGGIDPGVTYPELLTTWIERLDWVAAQGFKIINLHTPEYIGAANQPTVISGGNNCCPFSFELSDHLGGEAGLKAFCDACHERGIEVMVWICGHLHREAPIWKEHPEWIARTADGRIWDGHYGIIHSLDLAQEAARRWMTDQLIHLRQATGIDAVWCDSFAGLFLGVVNHASADRAPAHAGVFKMFGELAEAGLSITLEGMSQLGVSSWGNLPPDSIVGKQELLVNTSFRYFVQRDWLDNPSLTRDAYLRSLAARAPFAVWCDEYLGRPEPFPLRLPDWHAPLTRAFNQVEPLLHRRQLLPHGALWFDANDQPSAFFAFADGDAPVDATFTDLVSGEERRESLQAGRIYKINDRVRDQ